MTCGSERYRRGLWAEALACLLLRFKLYRILARRFKTGVGEIDIVAARGRTLVIVEVKARATRADASVAISSHQQERLKRAARLFLAAHPTFATADIRFDAILVAPRRMPLHIENAFSD